MRHVRLVLALGAFFVFAAALTACGGGVPGDAVATVGDQSITKSQFNHWLAIAAKGNAQTPGQQVAVPAPPDFKQCIAQKRKTTPKPAKGQPTPKDSQFRQQCEQ